MEKAKEPYSQMPKALWQRGALAQSLEALRDAVSETYFYMGNSDTPTSRAKLKALLVNVKSKAARAEDMLGKLP